MGEQNIQGELEGERLRTFLRHLLDDLRALEWMISNDLIERGVKRIGAEQELFLVGPDARPAPAAMEMLAAIDDPHFTTEIAAFNLEANLDPLDFAGDCFSRLERQIVELLAKAREAGQQIGVRPVLAGILPTIREADLDLSNLTPAPRYAALNNALGRLRGGPYEFRIKGTDELILKHDTTMVEACNTSFQVHLQVDPSDFARRYNAAQVVTAPVLAAATNSPLLFGRRLWRETRIALFQQAVDTRGSLGSLRERSPRVTFGSKWVDESVLELYREDVARFRVLLGADLDDRPFEDIARGDAPSLVALRLHNGTVYRWNRACYGISNGKPHIRIENRVLPSGPSVLDEVANGAFWLGLVEALPDEVGDVRERIAFADAKQNFVAAARLGLSASFTWLDGETVPAPVLILDHLLPLAADGLRRRGVDESDVDRYLGVIRERVETGRTGSSWMLRSLESIADSRRPAERLATIVEATIARQSEGRPVAEWQPATIEEGGDRIRSFSCVECFMTTDLFTVREDESVDLAASLMDWKHVRHIPVEDGENRLVGIVSYRALLRLLASGVDCKTRSIAVADVMKRDPLSIAPETPTLEAIALMRRHGVSALPVVKHGRLVGIVSERDMMDVTTELLEERLRGRAAAQ
jgi:CBS domain-containing protein